MFQNKQPDLIKKFFSKMAVLAKNGVWLGAFLTEVNFSYELIQQIISTLAKFDFTLVKVYFTLVNSQFWFFTNKCNL